MITVKNLTNSPFDLQSPKGTVRLPAFGQVSGEFTGEYLQLLKASLAVEVIEKTEDSGDALGKLRTDYQEVFGKRPFHGWSAKELQEKIDAKLAE
ncbi:hypothetical protein [Agrobacterium tumefaciens]|uniref:hypothetical protein n=1 Tax=Agrobacterium tumefaciens TaxID=358 RepID=UPI0015738012|nr:hypothetical protein [Agrobacterium tumefaciens]NSX90131.1 hypothetical protein [Agrobacterium tumefaciens]